MPPRILLSWSSGKDSAWALHALQQQAPGAVQALLTTLNESADRVAMHGVRRAVLEAQAAAVGLPLRPVPLPQPCPNDEYEARIGAAYRTARDDGFTHVAFGDLFLQDIRQYREQQLEGTGLTPLFPLWGLDTASLARTMIAGGLRARLSVIDTRALDRSHVGREFDTALLDALPPDVDPCGERGEFHTCVYDGPSFRRPLVLTPGVHVDRAPFLFCDL